MSELLASFVGTLAAFVALRFVFEVFRLDGVIDDAAAGVRREFL